MNNIWRHKKCTLILQNATPKRCLWCEKIVQIFRVYKQRSKITNGKKNIGPTLTPNRLKTLQTLQRNKHKTQKCNYRLEIKYRITKNIFTTL